MSEMKDTKLEEAAALLDLPDDVMLAHGITVISFLDKDGNQSFEWLVHGEPLLSTILGMIVALEHILVRETLGSQ